MSVFVLVHGAWHGAWCWDRLVPELRALGHQTIAPELPIEDGTATFADYARLVTDAAADAGDDVVLVGHSLGSMTIPVVATQRPVSALVFLCGVIPNPGGLPWDDAPPMAEPGAFDAVVSHDDGSSSWADFESARKAFYPDCTEEDSRWAFGHLRPLNATSLWSTPYPLERFPDVPKVSIIGLDDAAITPEFSRHAARTRLGVEPIELPGGHSPFLARPADLARMLDQNRP